MSNSVSQITHPVTYAFRVAEHLFAISGEEAWLMTASNLAPFRLANCACDESDRLFTIRMQRAAQWSEPVGFTHFFTDNSEADMPRIEVYQSESEWLFRVAQIASAPTCCEVRVSRDFTAAELSVLEGVSPSIMRFAIDNCVMLLYAFATAHKGILEMHASVVVHEGKARLFLGHSGTGKSTHTRQWLAQFHTAYLLNDDNPVLRVDKEGKVWVYGTPWSGKTPCYRNERVPVAAIVQLEQAPENSISKLAPAQAYAYILSSCSGLKVLHEAMDGLHATISSIVLNVPILKLRCLPDKASAQLCYEATR